MDNAEDKDVNIVNTMPLLEDGIFPALPMDSCSCSPKDKWTDNQCPTMARADEDCCLAEWMRKEFYFKTKAKVEKAVKVVLYYINELFTRCVYINLWCKC